MQYLLSSGQNNSCFLIFFLFYSKKNQKLKKKMYSYYEIRFRDYMPCNSVYLQIKSVKYKN